MHLIFVAVYVYENILTTKFSQFTVSPLPVSEHVLACFVSTLAKQGLKHQTLKCYLLAVRHLQISHGYP